MPTFGAHEDIAKGGLGCPSLDAEHTIISTQRLTRALNDEGPLGRLIKAILQRQCAATDALSAAQLPNVSRYSMRVRQAMAMHKAKLVLKKDDTRQAVIDALAPLADSLKKLDAQPSDWDRRLVADLHTLQSVGIHTVESMLCHNRTNVLPHLALMSIMGKRKALDGQVQTLRRLAPSRPLPHHRTAMERDLQCAS